MDLAGEQVVQGGPTPDGTRSRHEKRIIQRHERSLSHKQDGPGTEADSDNEKQNRRQSGALGSKYERGTD
jgi:hypothetical protein